MNIKLIDADALTDRLRERHDFLVDGVGGFRFLTPTDKARVEEISSCIADVANATTVDAVSHGRWEPRSDIPGFVQCSACRDCNTYDEWPDGQKWKFCPQCGAKMDLEAAAMETANE